MNQHNRKKKETIFYVTQESKAMSGHWKVIPNHNISRCSVCKGRNPEVAVKDFQISNKSMLECFWKKTLNHRVESCAVCNVINKQTKPHQNFLISHVSKKRDIFKERIVAKKLQQVLEKEKNSGNSDLFPRKTKPEISNLKVIESFSMNSFEEFDDNFVPAVLSFSSPKKSNDSAIPIEDGGSDEDQSIQAEDILPNHETLQEVKSTSNENLPQTLMISSHLCSSCGETYDDFLSYKEHFQVCGIHFPAQCTHCSKILQDKTTWISHQTLHAHLFYQHKCGNCSMAFATNGALRNHLRFKVQCSSLDTLCKFCGKLFPNKDDLESHLKECNHNALKKNHVCKVCGDRFHSNASLRRHSLLHTEREKPFMCEDCGAVFTNNAGLRKHRLKHMERQYKCFECDSKFIYLGNLKTHMNIHIKEAELK